MQTFVYTLHFIVCFVLIGVVLLQRGKGADLGASLGGGGANTIFGGRGAGNFLTKITTASAVVFMCTSLSLAYMGYQASDVQLFDTDQPFEVPLDGVLPGAGDTDDAEGGGLQVIEGIEGVEQEGAGLIEIPSAESAAGAISDAAEAAGAAAMGAAETAGEAVENAAASVAEGVNDAASAASDAAAEAEAALSE